MWKKMLASGAAVLALGLFADFGDCSGIPIVNACEEGNASLSTPGGIPYSRPLAYSSRENHEMLYDESGHKLLMDAFTYEVQLDGSSAVDHPRLQQSLKKLSGQNLDDLKNMVNDCRSGLIEEYELGKANGLYADDTVVPFAYEHDFQGLRVDTAVCSFAAMEYIYMGGAHPGHYYITHSFDTKSGRELKLSDIFKTKEGLAEIIATETKKQMGERVEMLDYNTMVGEIQQMLDDNTLAFGLDNDGMIVFFSDYDIGPYVIGTMEINIPYTKYFELFQPKYIFYGERPRG
ncbi:MAG: DUF3298 and DUF4163 domain-containing protein [Anaerovibrio sp.]|uniref:DUF3298 and DUF4163 domain-containing protein n=1 Tax=Anaerovibrio sp. TaxID=1872532 RepID=UPI00260066C5|nr:DUF3298 and DUF4163 domain-containing protein [Anaerovibrio sp.]MCR5176169.1 DUF3298 and DUF4163 domain-containing protein [Anaerovibrio sp.]